MQQTITDSGNGGMPVTYVTSSEENDAAVLLPRRNIMQRFKDWLGILDEPEVGSDGKNDSDK